eukprot:764009-Hanusia_phi.AAC.1
MRQAREYHLPAGHMQSSSDELPNGDMRPDGQAEQEGPSSRIASRADTGPTADALALLDRRAAGRRPGVGGAGFAGGLRAPCCWGRVDVEVPSYRQRQLRQTLGNLSSPKAAEAGYLAHRSSRGPKCCRAGRESRTDIESIRLLDLPATRASDASTRHG